MQIGGFVYPFHEMSTPRAELEKRLGYQKDPKAADPGSQEADAGGRATARGLKGLDFVVRDGQHLQALGGGHPGHAEGAPQHRDATCAWCRSPSGSTRRPAGNFDLGHQRHRLHADGPVRLLHRVVRQGRPAELLRAGPTSSSTPSPGTDRARGRRQQAQDHGPPGRGHPREGPAADPGRRTSRSTTPGTTRCAARTRSTYFGIYDVVRWDQVWMALGWPPGPASSVARAEVPPPEGALRPGHPDRGLPDHLRGAAHPAGRSAGGHPRRGGPRQDGAGGSRGASCATSACPTRCRCSTCAGCGTSPPGSSASRSSAATPWPT